MSSFLNFFLNRFKERSTLLFFATGLVGVALHYFPELAGHVTVEKVLVALTFLGLVPDKKA